MPDASDRSLRHLMRRGETPRLGPLLRALAGEAQAQLAAESRHALAVRTGERLAEREPLVHGESLAALEQAVGAWFARHGWGWVTLHDRGDWLEIEQACHPLGGVLGDEGARWAAAFFEGLFAGWLRQAGADPALQLRCLGIGSRSDERIRFGFAVPAVHARIGHG